MKKNKPIPIVTRLGSEWDTNLFARKPIPTITRSQLAIDAERQENWKKRKLCIPKEDA